MEANIAELTLEPIEERSYSFIIRIWKEPHSIQDEKNLFRGMLIDVATNEKFFFLNLDSLVEHLIMKTKFPRSFG